MPTRRQRRAAIENTDVVEPKETALEKAPAETVLTVNPPPEIRCKLTKDGSQEVEVGLAPQRLLRSIEKNRGPGLDRRINVAEVPLVSRNLPRRMLVDLS